MRRTLAAAVLAAGLAAMGGAVAQPFHGGHGGGGLLFGPRLEAIKPSLNLTAAQDAQWSGAVAQAQAARDSMRSTWQATRQAIRDEMAKSDPDLFRLAQLRDSAEDTTRSLRRQVRDTWLQVYAALTPAQQATVREAMKSRAGRGPWGARGDAPRG
jgi:Spy/CpxP family protein refolding chaperone